MRRTVINAKGNQGLSIVLSPLMRGRGLKQGTVFGDAGF